ncbi:MAG: sigma factor [Clostridia bacterium]|jgi:RNA polymerase sporulation-specific sigma factor|nr:rNA polymerase sigma factor [Clostridium sp. CAG:571]
MYENSMEEIYKAQNGNQEAMSKLVKQNSGLVWSIVKRFNSRGYELEDLYQIGSLRFSKSNKKI